MADANGSTVNVFAGKGGVGKTTCSATSAFHFASLGEKTLALSTDATPSLLHIFEASGGGKPVKVNDWLHIREIGVEETKEMWDGKFGREVYEVFSSLVDVEYKDFVEFMTSLLPGLSEEFMVDYIRELSRKGEYRNIVWDTAPLGQTLALLETPAMLGEHLKMAPRIYSRLKVGQKSRQPILDIIKRWENLSAANMDFLRKSVSFSMVTIPEALAVQQLDGVFREMEKYGLKVSRLIINNVVRTEDSEFLCIRADQQKKYIDAIYHKYPHLQIVELPMFPCEVKGLERLKEVERLLFQKMPA
ncbi:MAG: ArsA family ATPase [Chloroflexi bacterium]|nr:ArsA family ATPase [Chloroflexota bacterium]